MARDHARINLTLWGDDDWMDLSVDAQMLYMMLYSSPGLTFCGAGEWHPGRLAARACDWTVERIETAAAELSRGLFLIIDTTTEEFLIRSWVKHDGLWRTPNMAVRGANARGALASRTLRGVVVFEVAKLHAANPDSTSWTRPAVRDMLSGKAVDASELEPFNPTSNPGPNPDPKGGPKGGSNPYGHPGSKGGSKGGSTPAPTPKAPTPKGGYVSTEGYVRDGELPPPNCESHPNGTERPCRACGAARERHDAAVKQREADELQQRRERKRNCQICGGTGQVEVANNAVRKCECTLPIQEPRHA